MAEQFRTRYRIVTDRYAGFEVQQRLWWLPWWHQPQTNTHCSIEQAHAFIAKMQAKQQVAWEEPQP